jgi:succinate dehydrogenase flavin-adding protein (antitoxin of CptAB toxin-antitoxin module)
VFNNGALGFIELEQKSTGFLDFGTELNNPNFAAMAEAIGIRGIRLTNPAEVDEGIAEALAHDGPVLIDAVVARTELAMPPSITVEMAKGFSLYMIKAVMNYADEIVDFAKTISGVERNRPLNTTAAPATSPRSHSPSQATAHLDVRCKRLLFRCWHRGTQEGDLILGRFAEAHLAGFDVAQLDQFEALLDCTDADLFDWIVVGNAPPKDHDRDVMNLLRDFCATRQHRPAQIG